VKCFLWVLVICAGCSFTQKEAPARPETQTPAPTEAQIKIRQDLILNLWLHLHSQRKFLLEKIETSNNPGTIHVCQQYLQQIDEELERTWQALFAR